MDSARPSCPVMVDLTWPGGLGGGSTACWPPSPGLGWTWRAPRGGGTNGVCGLGDTILGVCCLGETFLGVEPAGFKRFLTTLDRPFTTDFVVDRCGCPVAEAPRVGG